MVIYFLYRNPISKKDRRPDSAKAGGVHDNSASKKHLYWIPTLLKSFIHTLIKNKITLSGNKIDINLSLSKYFTNSQA